MKRILISGGTDECVKLFKEDCTSFLPVRKLTVFFDNANFLLTPYSLLSSDVHMVIECENGNEVHLTGVNCGYGGKGPHGTKEILEILGLDEITTSRIIYETQIIIRFSNNVPVEIMANSNPFFQNRRLDNTNTLTSGCRLGETTSINLLEREVFMYSPLANDPSGIFNCIDIMGLQQIEFMKDGSAVDLNIECSTEKFYIHGKPKISPSFIFYGQRFNTILYNNLEDTKNLESILLQYIKVDFSVEIYQDEEEKTTFLKELLALLKHENSNSGVSKKVTWKVERKHGLNKSFLIGEKMYGKF